MQARSLSPAPVIIPPFPVTTDRAIVARFAAAVRASSDDVPATFPISWLAHPTVRGALVALAAPGEIAIHEDQSFDYRRPLALDRTYHLHARAERTGDPSRLRLDAEVRSENEPVLTMRMALRLLDTAPAELR